MKYIIVVISLVFIIGCLNKNSKIDSQKSINQDITISNKQTIAIIYSSRIIGKYAIKISNLSFVYISNTNDNFRLEFIDIQDENLSSISEALDTLKSDGVTKVLFYITEKGFDNFIQYDKFDNFSIYLPLINQYNHTFRHKNIIYGGINYKKQFDKIEEIATSKIVEVYDNTYKSKILHNTLYDNNITSFKLDNKYPNYEKFIEEYNADENSSLVINLNVIKSSILLSQLRRYDDINITDIYVTQNSFTPLLFRLTQIEDTQKLSIISSTLDINNTLNNLLKLNGFDVKYDWVNYSTILGLEYLMYKQVLLFDNIHIVDNQVDYPINIYKTKGKRFIKDVKSLQ